MRIRKETLPSLRCCQRWSRSQTTEEQESYEREKSSTHKMGLRVPRGMDIPKYRRKVLYRECRAEVGGIIRELIEKKTGCEVVEGSICIDHIHVCLKDPSELCCVGRDGVPEGKERTDALRQASGVEE